MRAVRGALLVLLLVATARVRAQADAAAAPAPVAAEAPATPAGVAAEAPATPAGVAPEAATTPAPAAAAPVTPPAAYPPAQDAGGPAQLSEAELASLGVSVEEQGLDTDLHLSGFMDVSAVQLLNPKEAALNARVYGDEASFLVGHLNLYVTKNITESFRMMAEVRFLYSPNGSQVSVLGLDSTYTETQDYNPSGAFLRWGGIVIERAYGEWSPLPFLSLRLGAFLTPYGIWNVDHGTPVFIPVMRPYAVNGNFFPEHQTGLEAFGRYGLTPNLAVRYHLTLSNGLGPVSEYRDLDSNKAIGGRLAFEYIGLGTLQVGGSVFYGQNSAGTLGLTVNSSGTALTVDKTIADQADVLALAADVLWKYRGLHLQGEWVGQRRDYTTAGRTRLPTAGLIGIPANAVSPDVFDWAGYVLAGYRLPWLGIMPFATLEYQRSNRWGIMTKTFFSQLGLNIRPSDAIVVKLEYQFGFAGTASTRFQLLAAQVAWAF